MIYFSSNCQQEKNRHQYLGFIAGIFQDYCVIVVKMRWNRWCSRSSQEAPGWIHVRVCLPGSLLSLSLLLFNSAPKFALNSKSVLFLVPPVEATCSHPPSEGAKSCPLPLAAIHPSRPPRCLSVCHLVRLLPRWPWLQMIPFLQQLRAQLPALWSEQHLLFAISASITV